ncbi:MAG: GTP-binding protein [Candidatus Lokiarchaeota archaeon]|nr:GTP-binding protein [Candidatus Lokiarchaeota archaeon]
MSELRKKAERLIKTAMDSRAEGFFSEAVKTLEEVISIYKELNLVKEQADIEIEIGNIYWQIGRHSTADKHYKNSDEIYDKLNIPKDKRHISKKDLQKKEKAEEEEKPEGKYSLKMVVIGDPSVGKSSLIRRFSDDKFEESYSPTIGTDFNLKIVKLPEIGVEVSMSVWDIGGHEQFSSIRQFYYQGANCGLIVYDVTRKETFKSIKYWYDDLKKWTGHILPIAILGNKSDLEEKEVSEADINKLSSRIQASWYETSAKTGKNVNEAFTELAKKHFKK